MSAPDSPPGSSGPQPKRLYRSCRQKFFGGVCGGFAEYFNLDVTLVRVIWILSSLFAPPILLAYILLWIIIPPGVPTDRRAESHRKSNMVLLGLLLAAVGLTLLGAGSLYSTFILPGLVWHFAFPGVLTALGVGLLLGWLLTRSRETAARVPPPESSRLYRSRDQRIFAGLCGGLGEYFRIDPNLVRLLWVVLGLASFGLALLLYVLLYILVPETALTRANHAAP